MHTSRQHIPEKYPDRGLTIFSVMSALAHEHLAINLSQGFPDFEIDQEIKERLAQATHLGHNQYAPMAGWPDLQKAIALKTAHYQHIDIDASHEVTITPGATYGIYVALTAIIQKDDEVIVLEPAYDSYVPNIVMNGGVPICLPLSVPDFRPDWDMIRAAVTDKTKAIIINNPHNPCGAVWSDADMRALEDLCVNHDLFLISDEVYEHIVFDGQPHLSAVRYSGLRERAFVVGSFGKILHNTGWKVGYVIAPPYLTQALRKIHQYLAFSVNTPAQQAIAAHILEDVSRLSHHAAFLQEKRDLFLQHMSSTKFQCLAPSAGSYFQILDYSNISDMPEDEFAIWLTKECGVAAIPLTSFYHQSGTHHHLLRFCFSKKEETLIAAAEKLANL